MTDIRTVELPSGVTVPALGQGTWHLGDDPDRRAEEIATLRLGLDLGLTLVDTAEMYGDGRSERLVGEALRGRRDEAFLVSKVLPSHADAAGSRAACHASLARLGTDRLDLYLLHWRGSVPLAETVGAMEDLVAAGDILSWGVSNLDPADLDELDAAGGAASSSGPQVDQVLYNLTRRGPELDLFPACARRGVRPMAYSPIEQGRVLGNAGLEAVARDLGATPAQVALAWVLRRTDVVAIPKASGRAHVEQNAGAAALELSEDVLTVLDREFPAPSRPIPLEMI